MSKNETKQDHNRFKLFEIIEGLLTECYNTTMTSVNVPKILAYSQDIIKAAQFIAKSLESKKWFQKVILFRRCIMKRIGYLLILIALGMLVSQVQPVFASEANKNIKLIGFWTKTLNATDPLGNPCPFVPDTMEFFKDQTITLSNFAIEHLPFKTDLTMREKQMMEERNPDLKGKKLLLVKPDPSIEWLVTPMVYGYSIEKNELTFMLQGWSAAKFTRTAK
jgi:hypothetical protein